jgi:hypothetical protein
MQFPETKLGVFFQETQKRVPRSLFISGDPTADDKPCKIRRHAGGELVGPQEPLGSLVIAPGAQMAIGSDAAVQMNIRVADVELYRARGALRPCVRLSGKDLNGVPSGMRLEFGGGISGNMRLSFQAARSIG